MENLQNIGQSFLFYSFLKRLKLSVIDIQSYHQELIALSSDILVSKITEKMNQLEQLQEEPENIEKSSISQIYFSFRTELTNSQYIQHLASCFHDFFHSQKYPINQLDQLQLPDKLKQQVREYLLNYNENIINEKQLFSIYNSDDNIYQKNNHKINCFDDISHIFASYSNTPISINFKSSIEQLQKMINLQIIIQKILQMKPFFKKIEVNMEDNQIENEYSDSEVDTESSASGSGSESYLDPESDLKIGEVSSDPDKPSYSDANSSVESQNDQVLKLKIELDSTINNLKAVTSENICLKSKIEKLLNEKIDLNEQLHDVEELRKEQINAVEENAILKKENEKLKELNEEMSSSMASLVIVPSSDLNDIVNESSKDVVVLNNYDSKDNNKSEMTKEVKILNTEKKETEKAEQKSNVVISKVIENRASLK